MEKGKSGRSSPGRRLGLTCKGGRLILSDAGGTEVGKVPSDRRSFIGLCAWLVEEKGESPETVIVNLSGEPICGMADREACGTEWTKSLCQTTMGEILEDGKKGQRSLPDLD